MKFTKQNSWLLIQIAFVIYLIVSSFKESVTLSESQAPALVQIQRAVK